MNTKNENKKFNLEKFEIAKLKNPRMIFGGTLQFSNESVLTVTDTSDKISTRHCIGDGPPPNAPK